MEEDAAFVQRVFKNISAGVSELMARLPRRRPEPAASPAVPSVSVQSPEKSEPVPAPKKEDSHPLVVRASLPCCVYVGVWVCSVECADDCSLLAHLCDCVCFAPLTAHRTQRRRS